MTCMKSSEQIHKYNRVLLNNSSPKQSKAVQSCLLHFYLPFLPVNHNKRNWKTGEKQGRPGSIHHMCGYKVDAGGEGLTFKYICTKLESGFHTGQDE